MRRSAIAGTFLAALVVTGAERRFELRGRIEPAPHRALVELHGATTPFSAVALAGSNGKFRFKKLLPGAYTLSIAAPGEGEVRRTVEIGPSFADRKGRIELKVPFEPGPEAASELAARRGKVSVKQLAISERAFREYARAQDRLRERDVPGAMAHLERAVELAPQFVAAWNNLGTIAYQTRRYQDAERYFRKALVQEPGSYAPLVNLGGTLLSLGRYQEALPYNQRAVADQPGDALAHAQLGQNYFFLGNEDKALQQLKEAKRLDAAHFSQPQLLLARIYLLRAEPAKAAQELEEFLRLHPDYPDAARLRRQLERIRQNRTPPLRGPSAAAEGPRPREK